jgi:hypothetical protein
MKLRSMTPFDDVSEVKCMVLPFGIALFRRSRRHLRLSLDREHEWEHPHGYCFHGSHLLAWCHGLAHAINLNRIPSNPFPDHRTDRLSTRSPANWNADAQRLLHASANELASEPRRDAPVNQATAIRGNQCLSPAHLDRCAAAYREEYGGNEYGGLSVNCRASHQVN